MGNGAAATLGKKSSAKEVIDLYARGNANFLAGKTAVVTGGNSGIGLETCKALAYAGCKVIMGSRDVSKGEVIVGTEVLNPGEGGYAVAKGKELITVAQLDLEDLGSVKRFADVVLKEERIDFLVLNAGTMAIPNLERTSKGFEKQIGTNHFGHFYLVSLLREKLQKQAHENRVVALSSSAHRMAKFDVNDLHYKKDPSKYSAWSAYGNSKLANMLFAKELADQTVGTTTRAFSVHPGVIMTNLQRHIPMVKSGIVGFLFSNLVLDKTIPQGAATTVYACLEPSLADPKNGGSFLSDCAIATPKIPEGIDADQTLRKQLWKVTEQELQEALSK